MPTSKKSKKKKEGRVKVKKETIEALSIDLERLFDTLYESIRLNLERRKELSLRAQREHEEKGRGMFVVDAFTPDRSVETDIEALYQKLEWWNHERCVNEPLPEYTATDPSYNPEFYRYMHAHDPYADFIVSMVFREKSIGEWGTTSNTLGHYRGPNTVYSCKPKFPLNAYTDGEIGEKVQFRGIQCAALDCDVMKGSRYVPTECSTCGADAASCLCMQKAAVFPLEGKELKQCSGCKEVWYCSRECQVKDWKARHKYVCKGRKKKT